VTSEAAVDPPTVALALGAGDAAVHGVDEVLGREVRLVTLPPASGDVLSERIEQVRHLARLHHPHLLEVYDVDGLAPDTESTLVLENVAGEPLAVVLREGPIAEPAVARMGAQLASALAHAHAHGVEHGAIGAASVLVDPTHTDAWLVGLTASLSGPLPVVGPETDDDDGAARRRVSDVRALAAVLAGILEHAAATTDGDDPEAVTRPTVREDDAPVSPLAALLREVDAADPPSATEFSEQLTRIGRGAPAHELGAEPARLVPVVASWSESPATGDAPVPPEPVVPAALAAGPAVRARGAGGVIPFTVIGPAGRRARRAGVLATATATLALASGLVIWAGESHPDRPEAQAEVGVSAPSAIVPPPLLPPVTDAGSPSGSGGGGGTWTGGSSGSDQVAVAVASRKAALPEAPSRAAVVSPQPSSTQSPSTRSSSTRSPSTRSPSTRSAPIPDPTTPVGAPSRTRTPRPTPSTPPRTTTPARTTTPRTTTPTTTAAPTTTTASTTTTAAKSASSTATSASVAPTTTTSPSEQALLAAGP
jgi:serine/threonine-protein kinase